jgi:hypothetical protein
MVIDNKDFLIDFYGAVVNLADADTSNIFIVIDCRKKFLCR